MADNEVPPIIQGRRVWVTLSAAQVALLAGDSAVMASVDLTGATPVGVMELTLDGS